MWPCCITRPQWVDNTQYGRRWSVVCFTKEINPVLTELPVRQVMISGLFHKGDLNWITSTIEEINPVLTELPVPLNFYDALAKLGLISFSSSIAHRSGLDIKHLVYMPVGHMVLKIYVPCKNFHVPSQYLYKPCKAYSYCWENKYMPRLKYHLPSWARNHKILCALGQDVHALGMRAPLNVEPCHRCVDGLVQERHLLH